MIYVYTSIMNGWDNLRPPKVVSLYDNVRYVCFTNLPNLPPVYPWQYRPLPQLGVDSRSSRLPKILPHLLLPADLEISIYHDGNFQLSVLPEQIVDELLQDEEWAAHRHPCRNCVYQEAAILLNERIGTADLVRAQVARYRAENYPEHAGLWANGFLVRRHNPPVNQACEAWWKEFSEGCERDQLSFPPVRRRLELPVRTIDAEVYHSPYVKFEWHAAWKDKESNKEFLPLRQDLRTSLGRLNSLTGLNLRMPEF